MKILRKEHQGSEYSEKSEAASARLIEFVTVLKRLRLEHEQLDARTRGRFNDLLALLRSSCLRTTVQAKTE